MRTWAALAAGVCFVAVLACACGGGADESDQAPARSDASTGEGSSSVVPVEPPESGAPGPDGAPSSDAAPPSDASSPGDASADGSSGDDGGADAGVVDEDAGPGGPALRATVTGLVGGGLTLAVTTAVTTAVAIPGAGTTLLGRFPLGTGYQVRVATQPRGQVCHLTRSKGALAGDATIDVACGAPDLLISEVSNCVFASDACWFEVANPSSAALDLAAYTLRTSAASRGGGTLTPSRIFALPSLSIPAGGYAIVRGRATDLVIDGPRQVSVLDGDIVPNWSSSSSGAGFIELLRDGKSVDFVRFGSSTATPTTGEWIGQSAAGWPSGLESYQRGIARTQAMVDTDSAEDWPLRAYPTPAAVNDVTDDTDADGDGIPDEAEAPGGKLGGIDLYAMGARRGKKDIFVEIDHMVSTDPGIVPQRAALEKVVAAFAAHGIAIHFDTGSLFAASFDPTAFNLGGGNTVPFAATIAMGSPPPGVASTYAYKAQHFDVRRSWVFHYLVMGNEGADGGGGLGELLGNDLLVTLGGLFGAAPNANYAINTQAAAIMHELGHNLGLRHGGGDDLNHKPNYLSVMNYLYANHGLSTIGTAEGDRYYLRRKATTGAACGGVNTESDLFRPRAGPLFVLDYSDGSSSPLDERALDERAGLGRSGSVAVDYDCSGAATSGVSLDVNGDGDKTTLSDHDDWGKLDLAFGRHVSSMDALPLSSAGPFDPLRDDRQQVIHDPRPRF